MKGTRAMKSLGWIESFSIFGAAALLLFICTHYLIPFLSRTTGIETIFYWFVVAGLGVFLPLIITGILILKSEGYTLNRATWNGRLRFRRMTANDWQWSIGGLLVVAILSGLVMKGMEMIIGEFNHSPSFMSFEPLTRERCWLLMIWAPYWILNILGEEFIWRGVMLPRQELAFGKYTWLIHGFGWGLFHVAFGWQLLITLIPLLLIQSWIVQRTKNSWVGVIMHGGLNGPSFLAICFGLI